MYETWVRMPALLKAGRLNLEPLFGERASLDKFENAFTLLQGGLAGKILLYPNGVPRCTNWFLCFAFKPFADSRELTQNSSSTSRFQVRSATMSDTATIPSKQNPLQFVTDQLKDLRAKGVAPKLRVLEGEQKPVCMFDGREVINLDSNNYLGLTTHKALRKAALDAVKRYGAGAGPVRTIAGTMKIHMAMEEQIAAFKNVESCVVFHSGFTANAGTVSSAPGQGYLI